MRQPLIALGAALITAPIVFLIFLAVTGASYPSGFLWAFMGFAAAGFLLAGLGLERMLREQAQ